MNLVPLENLVPIQNLVPLHNLVPLENLIPLLNPTCVRRHWWVLQSWIWRTIILIYEAHTQVEVFCIATFESAKQKER